jgi:hypothetical protein
MHRFANTIRTLGKQPPCRDLGQKTIGRIAVHRHQRAFSSGDRPPSIEHAPKDIQPITWSNFDQGRWSEYLQHSPIYQRYQKAKQRKESYVLEEHSKLEQSPYPSYGSYALLRDYHTADLATYGTSEGIVNLCAQIHALWSVLETSPPALRDRLVRHRRRMRTNHGMLVNDAVQLRIIKKHIGHMQHVPLYAEYQIAVHRIAQSELSQRVKLRRARQKQRKIVQKDAQADQAPATDAPKNGSTEASPTNPSNDQDLSPTKQSIVKTRLQTLDNIYNTQPHLWAIGPMSSTAKRASHINASWFRNVQEFSASPTKRDEMSSLVHSWLGDSMELQRLQSEYKVLQFYVMQHYPEWITERRIELGKELFDKMQESHGRKMKNGGEEESEDE